MKKLAILTAALAIFLMGAAQVAMATPTLSGTINTITNPSEYGDNYRYSYLLSDIFTPGTSAFTISGHVSGLSFGHYSNWLDIGLVTESVVVGAPLGSRVLMNNHSAYFLVGIDGGGIYVEAKDYNTTTSNHLSLTLATFDFAFTVTPNSGAGNGKFEVKITDPSTHANLGSSSIQYGFDHTDEFTGNAYIIAQAYVDTTDSRNSVYAVMSDVKVVPLPGTLVLLGSGLAGLAFYRQRRASGCKS